MKTEDNAIIFDLAMNSLCQDVPHFTHGRTHKSMWNVELFFIFNLIMKKSPDAFFESGFYMGRSTEILLECLKHSGEEKPFFVASIKKNKMTIDLCKRYPNLQIIYKSGERAIKLIRTKNIAALIDGPKLKKTKQVFSIYNHLISKCDVRFICQHDLNIPASVRKFSDYHKKIRDRYNIKMMTKSFGKQFQYMDRLSERVVSGSLGCLIRRKK